MTTYINSGWAKLDKYYSLTSDSPAYIGAFVLHPAFKWQLFLCFFVSLFLCFFVSLFLCFFVSLFLCFFVSLFLCFFVL